MQESGFSASMGRRWKQPGDRERKHFAQTIRQVKDQAYGNLMAGIYSTLPATAIPITYDDRIQV